MIKTGREFDSRPCSDDVTRASGQVADAAASGGRTPWPPSWKYDVTSKTGLHIYLTNNPAKFHLDATWNDGALGFCLKSVAPTTSITTITTWVAIWDKDQDTSDKISYSAIERHSKVPNSFTRLCPARHLRTWLTTYTWFRKVQDVDSARPPTDRVLFHGRTIHVWR